MRKKVPRYLWVRALEVGEWALSTHFVQGPRELGPTSTGPSLYNTLLSSDNVFVKHCRLWQNPLGGLFATNRNMFGITFPFRCHKGKKKDRTGAFGKLARVPPKDGVVAEQNWGISLLQWICLKYKAPPPTSPLRTWRSACSLSGILGTEFRIQ